MNIPITNSPLLSILNSSLLNMLQDVVPDIPVLRSMGISFNTTDQDSNAFIIQMTLQSELSNNLRMLLPLHTSASSTWNPFSMFNSDALNILFQIDSTEPNEVNNGLTSEQIDKNSVKKIITQSNECHICLDTVLTGSCMRQLIHCGHKYCVDCIDAWLQNHNTCPLCKATLQ